MNRLAQRYRRWEDRGRRRLSGWSVRRRWVVLVLVPTLVCCAGAVVGAPVVWVLRKTLVDIAAERTPEDNGQHGAA